MIQIFSINLFLSILKNDRNKSFLNPINFMN